MGVVVGPPDPPRSSPGGLPLPDPPLADPAAGIALRPWRPTDAPDLAAAWADAEVAVRTAVPPDRSVAAATRWIGGEAERRGRGLALDLVIAPTSPATGGRALGEVGLARFDTAGRAEVGFWLVPEARGRGVATAAVRLLARWARAPRPAGLGLARVWARTMPGDARAAGVLARAGFERRGEAGGTTVWATPPAMLRA